MRRRTVLALGVLALAGACGVPDPPRRQELLLVVPEEAGRKAERVARELTALIEGRWAARVRLDGAGSGADDGGGMGGLARFVEDGRAGDLLVTDTRLLTSAALGECAPVAGRAVPLARLVGEWEVLVTSPDSGFRTFDEFAAALRRNPAGPRVAGGATGGPEHLLYGLTAKGLGADLRRLNYAAFPDPADLIAAVLDGQAPLAFGTRSDLFPYIRAGRLRPLAVSSSERLAGVDAPTLLESGVRLVYADWTGLVGPRTLPDRERQALLDLCAAIAGSPAWQRACDRNGWACMYLAGGEFGEWLVDEARRTGELLRDLGLR
ncbi:MAG: hypothetical protein IRY84_09105 [Thermobispora bispora]|nr:hypothetical protein [Thermobispora bispora]